MAGEATSSFRATGREAEELESPPGATDTPKALPDGSGLHRRHRHQGGSAADLPIPTDATSKNLASAARESLKKTEVGLPGCDFDCLAACWENTAAARVTRQERAQDGCCWGYGAAPRSLLPEQELCDHATPNADRSAVVFKSLLRMLKTSSRTKTLDFRSARGNMLRAQLRGIPWGACTEGKGACECSRAAS